MARPKDEAAALDAVPKIVKALARQADALDRVADALERLAATQEWDGDDPYDPPGRPVRDVVPDLADYAVETVDLDRQVDALHGPGAAAAIDAVYQGAARLADDAAARLAEGTNR